MSLQAATPLCRKATSLSPNPLHMWSSSSPAVVSHCFPNDSSAAGATLGPVLAGCLGCLASPRCGLVSRMPTPHHSCILALSSEPLLGHAWRTTPGPCWILQSWKKCLSEYSRRAITGVPTKAPGTRYAGTRSPRANIAHLFLLNAEPSKLMN